MRLWFLLLLFAVCTACAADSPSVELRGRSFDVEIADTSEKHALGLMFRNSMPADEGMLFIFGYEAPQSFWMRNTRIPLDIMYFDKDLKLVSMAKQAQPCRVSRCPSYPSVVPAQYVLELNGGTADKLGVKLGDPLIVRLD